MKYSVNFSCGHTETVELFGKTKDRDAKIAWFERSGVCSCCYREQQEIAKSIGCAEVEMPYKDYKQSYATCKTKSGSYNGTTKTIIVYVPQEA